MRPLEVQANDPWRAGQLASRRALFGDGSRYAVAAVHTRFGVRFFVWDAEVLDVYVTGGPSVIRQVGNLADAVAGLPGGELASLAGPSPVVPCGLCRGTGRTPMLDYFAGVTWKPCRECSPARLSLFEAAMARCDDVEAERLLRLSGAGVRP